MKTSTRSNFRKGPDTMSRRAELQIPPGPDATRKPPLPQDLFTCIIFFLQGDVPSLCTCSLVSRSWARLTATHLFALRRWPKCQHFWAKARTVKGCVCSQEKPKLPALRNILVSSDRIRHALRDLDLNFERVPGGPRGDKPGQMPMGCVNVDELMDVFDVLPNLRSVKISRCNGFSWPVKDRAEGQPARSLGTFTFSKILHIDSSVLAALISYFGRISRIFLHHDVLSTLPEHPRGLSPAPAGNSCVHTLDFGSLCSDASSMAKYLRSIRTVVDVTNLRELSLSIPDKEEAMVEAALFLDGATELDKCTFHIVDEGDAKPGPRVTQTQALDHWSSLVRLLGHCNARIVAIVLVPIAYQTSSQASDLEQYLRGLEWRQLNEALASRERLEKVQIWIDPGLERGQWIDFNVPAFVDKALRLLLTERLRHAFEIDVLPSAAASPST